MTLVATCGRYVLTVATATLVARFLAPADFGIVGMATAVLAFASVLNDMGLGVATVQCERIDGAALDTMFWLSAAAGVVTAALLCVLALPVAHALHEHRVAAVIAANAVTFVLGGFSTQHLALLRRHLRFGTLAWLETLAALAGAVVAVAGALLGAGYWALVAQTLTAAAVTAAGAWTCVEFRPRFRCVPSEVRPLLKTSADVAAFSVVCYFARNLDNVLVGRAWGATELGFYNRAYSLLLLPLNQINQPVSRVAIPALTKLRDAEFRRTYLRLFEAMMFLGIPAAAFLVACSDWCIVVLLGPNWLPASRIFRVLGLAGLIAPINNAAWWLFMAQGRTREMLKLGVVSSALAVASFFVGLPWGGLGLATSFFVCDLFLRTPLIFWAAGRRGAVTARHLYGAAAPCVALAAATLLPLIAFRATVTVRSPLLGLAVAGSIVVAASLLTHAVLRATRSTARHPRCLQDMP